MIVGVIPENVPTGWPVKCPGCESWSFYYISDKTGNHRLYNCKKCLRRYVAVWRGRSITSALNEPKNTRMENWQWIEVVEEDESEFIDVEFDVVTDEFRDGSPPMKIVMKES